MLFSFLLLFFVLQHCISSCPGLNLNTEEDYFGKDDDIIPPRNAYNSTDYSISNDDTIPSATFFHAPNSDPKWPNATVPYVFHHNMRDLDRNQAIKAMTEYHKHSCVRFIKWTGEPDYLRIEYSNRGECSSHVGRQGGPQPLYLSPKCARSVGVAMHEFMHALGFVHEHMRPDRDTYVYINYSNIDQAHWKNFEIDSFYVKLKDLRGPYDFNSLMHYRLCAMSNSSLPTIIPKVNPGTKLIGQRFGFSKIDIKKLNKFYNCSSNRRHPEVLHAEIETNLYTQKYEANNHNASDNYKSNSNLHLCSLKLILLVMVYKYLFSYTSVVNYLFKFKC